MKQDSFRSEVHPNENRATDDFFKQILHEPSGILLETDLRLFLFVFEKEISERMSDICSVTNSKTKYLSHT